MNLTVVIIFGIIFLGCLLGKISVRGISFGVAGVLIVSIMFGLTVNVLDGGCLDDGFYRFLAELSSFGMSVFIATIGVQSGYLIVNNKMKRLILVVFGFITVIVSFLPALFISAVDKTVSPSLVYGVFCGAMTSTPGLAALSTNVDLDGNLASVGYGSAYLIGVISTVLFVQIKCRVRPQREVEKAGRKAEYRSGSVLSELTQIAAVVVLGSLIGAVRVPRTDLTIGTTGGVLAAGMLVGFLAGKSRRLICVSDKTVNVLRNFGLVLFLVGNGIPAGQRLLECWSPRCFVYGAIFTVVPIAVTYYFSKVLFKNRREDMLCSVCGAMTSTPAYGVLLGSVGSSETAAVYALTYTGALAAMVVTMSFA